MLQRHIIQSQNNLRFTPVADPKIGTKYVIIPTFSIHNESQKNYTLLKNHHTSLQKNLQTLHINKAITKKKLNNRKTTLRIISKQVRSS